MSLFQPRGKPMRNEAHIVNQRNGHLLSADCWCEPVSLYWRRNAHGTHVLVVEHNDYTMEHHSIVIARRHSLRSTPFAGNFIDLPINQGIEAPWITRALSIEPPPKLLPPASS